VLTLQPSEVGERLHKVLALALDICRTKGDPSVRAYRVVATRLTLLPCSRICSVLQTPNNP
jgi:hypothetical protein